MKRLLLAIALGALGFAPLHAQLPADDSNNPASIKVTSRINADGAQTDTQKDLENRTSETRTYDKAHKLLQRVAFSLDDQGRETEGVICDGKDKVLGRVSLKYNLQGHLSEQIEKDAAGLVKRRTVILSDATGQVTGVEVYDGQGNRIQQDTPAPTPKLRKKK